MHLKSIMDINFPDTQFENIQMMRLVKSAEELFQRLHNSVCEEEKGLIDQWLCLKQECEDACNSNSSFIDSNENLDASSMLSPIDEVSETEENSNKSEKLGIQNPALQTIKSDDDDCVIQQTSIPLKSNFEKNLNSYVTDFKSCTDLSVFDWLSNLSSCIVTATVVPHTNYTKSSGVDWMRPEFIPAKNNFVLQKHNNALRTICDFGNRGTIILKQEIQRLQEFRIPLIQIRRNIIDSLAGEPLETSSKYRDYVKLEIVIEAIDISIEMKNQLFLGHNILNLFEIVDQADTTVADCLHMLSPDEVKCLLITFLKKVVDIRESSSKLDKEMLKLDNFVAYQKFQIRGLKKMMNYNKAFYENQFVIMRKECDEKMKLMYRGDCTNSIGSSQENNLMALVPKSGSDHQSSMLTELRKLEIMNSNIPNMNLKTLKNNNGPPDVKVTRYKNKLIIQRPR